MCKITDKKLYLYFRNNQTIPTLLLVTIAIRIPLFIKQMSIPMFVLEEVPVVLKESNSWHMFTHNLYYLRRYILRGVTREGRGRQMHSCKNSKSCQILRGNGWNQAIIEILLITRCARLCCRLEFLKNSLIVHGFKRNTFSRDVSTLGCRILLIYIKVI